MYSYLNFFTWDSFLINKNSLTKGETLKFIGVPYERREDHEKLVFLPVLQTPKRKEPYVISYYISLNA